MNMDRPAGRPRGRLARASFALALAAASLPAGAAAQAPYLGSTRPSGQPVAPFFEGWYANADGSYTFSFGYFNFNTQEIVRIPVGPANRILPDRFDRGEQPTVFAPRPDRRERGAFTVTVPGEFAESGEAVIWELTAHGTTYSVPARIGVDSYQLDYAPRAGGSVAPLVAFEPNDMAGQNPSGVWASFDLTARVTQPIEITVWAGDPSNRPDDATRPDAGVEIPIGLRWFTHQGPAPVAFRPPSAEIGPFAVGELGPWTTSATFSEPGSYVLRVRADNWTARDSGAGDQCCWTNGYVRVRVSP